MGNSPSAKAHQQWRNTRAGDAKRVKAAFATLGRTNAPITLEELTTACQEPAVLRVMARLRGGAAGNDAKAVARLLMSRFDKTRTGTLLPREVNVLKQEVGDSVTKPFTVFLDQAVASAGSTVRGVVMLDTPVPVLAASVTVMLQAKVGVNFVKPQVYDRWWQKADYVTPETYSPMLKKHKVMNVTCKSEIVVFKHTVNFDVPHKKGVIPAGLHRWTFSFQLPAGAPESFSVSGTGKAIPGSGAWTKGRMYLVYTVSASCNGYAKNSPEAKSAPKGVDIQSKSANAAFFAVVPSGVAAYALADGGSAVTNASADVVVAPRAGGAGGAGGAAGATAVPAVAVAVAAAPAAPAATGAVPVARAVPVTAAPGAAVVAAVALPATAAVSTAAAAPLVTSHPLTAAGETKNLSYNVDISPGSGTAATIPMGMGGAALPLLRAGDSSVATVNLRSKGGAIKAWWARLTLDMFVVLRAQGTVWSCAAPILSHDEHGVAIPPGGSAALKVPLHYAALPGKRAVAFSSLIARTTPRFALRIGLREKQVVGNGPVLTVPVVANNATAATPQVANAATAGAGGAGGAAGAMGAGGGAGAVDELTVTATAVSPATYTAVGEPPSKLGDAPSDTWWASPVAAQTVQWDDVAGTGGSAVDATPPAATAPPAMYDGKERTMYNYASAPVAKLSLETVPYQMQQRAFEPIML